MIKKITNTIAKQIIKDVHLKRLEVINKYFEKKTIELENKLKNELNIPDDIELKAKEVEKLLNEIFKYYNIDLNYPNLAFSDTYYNKSIRIIDFIDDKTDIPITVKITDKSLNTRHTYRFIAKEFKKEYDDALNAESEAYNNVLNSLKGVKKEQMIIDIVKEGYDLDLTKYRDKIVEKKPKVKKFKFNKEFCEAINENNK